MVLKKDMALRGSPTATLPPIWLSKVTTRGPDCAKVRTMRSRARHANGRLPHSAPSTSRPSAPGDGWRLALPSAISSDRSTAGLGWGRYGLRRGVTITVIDDGAWEQGHEEKDQGRGARVEPHQFREAPSPAVEEPGPEHVGAAQRKIARAHHEGKPETFTTARRGAHGKVHQGQLRPDADEAAHPVDDRCGLVAIDEVEQRSECIG